MLSARQKTAPVLDSGFKLIGLVEQESLRGPAKALVFAKRVMNSGLTPTSPNATHEDGAQSIGFPGYIDMPWMAGGFETRQLAPLRRAPDEAIEAFPAYDRKLTV